MDCNEQKVLATLFHCLHQEPNTQQFIPFLHADKHYKGIQDDASQLLTRILQTREQVPAIYPLMKGVVVQTLRCLRQECQHAHFSIEEESIALQVSTRSEDGGAVLFTTVQQAIDAYLSLVDRVTLNEKSCPNCGFQCTEWDKQSKFVECPRVLMVVLKTVGNSRY